MYIGPSMTSMTGLNPGYRIYTVDGNYNESSRQVQDHDTVGCLFSRAVNFVDFAIS